VEEPPIAKNDVTEPPPNFNSGRDIPGHGRIALFAWADELHPRSVNAMAPEGDVHPATRLVDVVRRI